MNEVADMYAKLEQLCLATPACAGWLLAWAQEGVAGRPAGLGSGSRYVCKDRVRRARPGWECDKLAIEIDDTMKALRGADASAMKAARAAAREAQRQARLALQAEKEARRQAREQSREIMREEFVPNPVICYNPATAIVITSDEMDHRLAADAAARRRKIFWCRSEGQRAKLRDMWSEE